MIGVDTVCPCTFGGGRISLSCSFSLTIPLPLISLSTARHLHPHPHRLSCSPHLSISLISQSPFAPRSLTIMPRRSSSTRPRRCTVLASLAERAGKHWVLPVGFCFVSPPRYSLFVRSRARSRTFFTSTSTELYTLEMFIWICYSVVAQRRTDTPTLVPDMTPSIVVSFSPSLHMSYQQR